MGSWKSISRGARGVQWLAINLFAFIGTPVGLAWAWILWVKRRRNQAGVRIKISLFGISATTLSLPILVCGGWPTLAQSRLRAGGLALESTQVRVGARPGFDFAGTTDRVAAPSFAVFEGREPRTPATRGLTKPDLDHRCQQPHHQLCLQRARMGHADHLPIHIV